MKSSTTITLALIFLSAQARAEKPSWDPDNYGPGSCNEKRSVIYHQIGDELTAKLKVQFAQVEVLRDTVFDHEPGIIKATEDYKESDPNSKKELKEKLDKILSTPLIAGIRQKFTDKNGIAVIEAHVYDGYYHDGSFMDPWLNFCIAVAEPVKVNFQNTPLTITGVKACRVSNIISGKNFERVDGFDVNGENFKAYFNSLKFKECQKPTEEKTTPSKHGDDKNEGQYVK